MKEDKLKKLTTENLKERINSHKAIIGISIGLSIAFAYFIILDYLDGKEIEMFNLIMIPCLFTGVFALFPELKAIQKELATRNN